MKLRLVEVAFLNRHEDDGAELGELGDFSAVSRQPLERDRLISNHVGRYHVERRSERPRQSPVKPETR